MSANQLRGIGPRTFISYSFQDREIATRLRDFLAASGFQVRMGDETSLLNMRLPDVLPRRVFGSTAYHVLILGVPRAEIMGVIGFLALPANLASVALLVPYKDGDANVRSVWLCSRNDAIGNVAVMMAALGVWKTTTAWPDLIVAAIMAGLFLWSSAQILRQGWQEYAEPKSMVARSS